ncbi:putative ABC transport system substrate-binding protein [Bradyrhizobium sp. USDA 4472]
MRRRGFVSGLFLAAILPEAALGQSPARRRVAIAHASSPVKDLQIDGDNPLVNAFFEELSKLGRFEGRNLEIVRFSADGRTDHFAELSDEIIKSSPEVIVANTSPFVRALKKATSIIPIVGITADPIAYGLTTSLSRPDSNVTGVSVDAGLELWGKRLAILRELVPSVSRVGFLTIRASWDGPQGQSLSRAGRDIGISIIGPPLDDPVRPPEYRRVLNQMRLDNANGIIVGDAAPNYTFRRDVVAVTNELRLPTMFPYRDFVEEGGLIAYAIDIQNLWRRAAHCVDELLRGSKVSDVPIYQASQLSLVINTKSAERLGLAVPASLALRADELIE